MKRAIILDTNFILENKKLLIEFKKAINDSVDIFIPRIVVDEVMSQKARETENKYNMIKKLIEENNKYFKFEENFKIDDVIIERKKGIEKFLVSYCNKNIIEYDKNLFSEILDRALYKKPPFVRDENSSDKGFKDAILWCSMLKSKKLSEYDEVLLVSNDKRAFLNKRDELSKEFNLILGKDIKIVNNTISEIYIDLGIIKNSSISESEENDTVISEDDTINFSNIKSELTKHMDEVIYTEIYNSYNGCTEHQNNFTIYQKINEDDTKRFFAELPKYIQEHIFFDLVDITELLNKIGISSRYTNSVPLISLKKINEIHNKIKNNDELYKPFLTYIICKFNIVYKYIPVDDDDPFAEFGDTIEVYNNGKLEIDDDFLQ